MIESADEFARLRSSSNPDEYGRAAHDEAPLEVWMEVIRRYPDMRSWVAHNKTVPVEVLSLLARDSDEHVRSMVAMKRKLPPEILEYLADDNYEPVRLSVARHKNTPKRVLERLVHDQWSQVRDVVRDRLTG